jgi:hypothetical protein
MVGPKPAFLVSCLTPFVVNIFRRWTADPPYKQKGQLLRAGLNHFQTYKPT